MIFVPGTYLIGDIKTLSGREDITHLDEGIHTLHDGAIVALYHIPEYLDGDSVMFDQDNNSYSCESGYLGIIRVDYLPFQTIFDHHNAVESEEAELLYSFETEMLPFSTSKFVEPDTSTYCISLGSRSLSHLENENAYDDYEEDDV